MQAPESPAVASKKPAKTKRGLFERAKGLVTRQADSTAKRPTPAASSTQTASANPRSDARHTSIVLDRILQWDKLVARCGQRDREHLVFLVHGSMEQDLHLFLRRIHSYLNEQCGWSHRLVKVERTRDGTTARTPDEWKRCLVQASQARRGELDFVLSVEAADAPVLLVFTDADGPLSRLDKPSTLGLIQFLRAQIDSVLTVLEARKVIKNPVRIVIPIEHPPSKPGKVDPVVEQLEKALRGATTLRLEQLPPLELPSWSEVADHIKNKYPDADAAILTECEAIHRRVLTSSDKTLQILGDDLDNALIDWLQSKHY